MSLVLEVIIAFGFTNFGGMIHIRDLFYYAWLIFIILIHMYQLCRGPALPCSTAFGFPNLGSFLGVQISCLRMFLNTVFGTHMCLSTFFCPRVSHTVSGLVGAQVCLIWLAESRRGNSLVQVM